MRGAIVGLLLLASPIGYAQAQPEKGLGDPAEKDRVSADDLFDKGRAHYEANKFQAAIELFTQAYSIVHDPVYLFNIAQSYRNSADCLNAFNYYNRYLTESPDAANAEAVRGWLRELQLCSEQRKKEQELAKRAEELERKLQTQPVRAPAPSNDDTRQDGGRTFRLAGLATSGVGVIGLVVGIVYGVKSQSYENEIAAACMTDCQWEEQRARDDAGRSANTISLIGYIGGAVALGAGAGLYIYGMQVERVTVTPMASGATVSARLRF